MAVVDGGELVELGLQGGQGASGWLSAQPLLQRLPEPLDLPLGLGVVGSAVLLLDAEDDQLALEPVGAVQESGGRATIRQCNTAVRGILADPAPPAPDEFAATIAFFCSLTGGVLNGSVVPATGGFIRV
jgi:hypothetical protein